MKIFTTFQVGMIRRNIYHDIYWKINVSKENSVMLLTIEASYSQMYNENNLILRFLSAKLKTRKELNNMYEGRRMDCT